jgi:DNA-directed RNA polymerase subunit E'/Rpb7
MQKNPNFETLFVNSLLSTKVILPFSDIGKNYKDIIQSKIAERVQGKCTVDGYIKPGSIEVVALSSGRVDIDFVEFQVTYRCDVCLPVEGMTLECISKTITQKAGIHAECILDGVPFISVFISRDTNLDKPEFSQIKESNMTIQVKIIGVCFELNDKTVTVMADLL